MILIDNTVLSNFAQAKAMSLLQEYCQNAGCVTREVWIEFENGRKKGFFTSKMNLDWLGQIEQTTPEEDAIKFHLMAQVEQGEASSLAIAILRKYNFLSDDLDARKIARREGVPLSGSIGILLELVRIGKLTLRQGNKILSTFIKNGYFSPVEQLDTLINNN